MSSIIIYTHGLSFTANVLTPFEQDMSLQNGGSNGRFFSASNFGPLSMSPTASSRLYNSVLVGLLLLACMYRLLLLGRVFVCVANGIPYLFVWVVAKAETPPPPHNNSTQIDDKSMIMRGIILLLICIYKAP